MKNIFTLFIAFVLVGSIQAQNLTQASLERTSSLQITVYAKSTDVVPAASNVLILFAISLPGVSNPASIPAVSNLGGTITPQPAEIIGGRTIYPYSMEAPSSLIAISNTLPGTAIAVITFPGSESGDLVQINDYTGSGTNNGYWYVSYSGFDGTNYVEKFYGVTVSNSEFGDSYAEAALPLPVSLVSFQAEKFQEKSSYLSWSTASEINSSHFVVQRSTDRKSWKTLGKVGAAGNSQFIESYEFVDQNVYNGLDSRLSVYYRLQMVDLDGQTKTSPIENVVFGNSNATGREFVLYPNPASDGVQIEWDAEAAEQPTALEFYDVTGKLIHTQKVSDNTNQEYVDFQYTNIKSGIYLVRIMNGTDAIEIKQVVVGHNR